MDTTPMAEQIELYDVARLVPFARNARTHSDVQIGEIAGGITAFGFIVPVLIDRNGGIIAGHGRVLAARKLGLYRIPVIVADHLSETDRRAYAIADNKIALNAGWDDELLKVELEALKSEGVQLEGLGFSQEEFNALIDELGSEPGQNDDSVPESPADAVSRAGDIWQLGQHRLVCGDALDPGSYTALLAGNRAAMVFTDLTMWPILDLASA